MKKKSFSVIVATIIVLFIAFVDISSQSNDSSDIFLLNVQALASSEFGSQPMDCYANVESYDDGRPKETQTYCGDCEPVKCHQWWSENRCMR